MTQKDFADKLNVSYSHLNNVIAKRIVPSRELADLIHKETNGEITVGRDQLSSYEISAACRLIEEIHEKVLVIREEQAKRQQEENHE